MCENFDARPGLSACGICPPDTALAVEPLHAAASAALIGKVQRYLDFVQRGRATLYLVERRYAGEAGLVESFGPLTHRRTR
jgi:hypothetical protein